MTDLAALNDADLDALRLAVLLEQERRTLIAQAPTQAEALAAQYSQAIGRHDGDPYQPVTGAHDAYPPGSVVEGNAGEYHRSTAWASHAPGTTGAPWERVWPDADGWTTTPPATGPLPWVQPTGAHDAYSFGATVAHTGRVWESTVAGERSNTWAPGVYGWKDLGPA